MVRPEAGRTRARVAFCERPPELVARVARAELGRFDLRIPAGDDPRQIRAAVEEASVLLARRRRVGRQEMEWSGVRSIVVLGREPVAVDSASASRLGIEVIPVPHPGAIAVADHTMALLLAVARRVVEGDRGVRSGAYRTLGSIPRPTTEESFAFNWLRREDIVVLDGRTLGLVGFGAIGQEVARRARGFGMRVRMFQRRPLEPPWPARLGVEPVASVREVLRTADVVSLHLPHTEHTANLLDAEALDELKPGAILVNTARGGLVDEAALVERLRSGRIAGAGLDVFSEEPLPASHPLVEAPGVVLAPHTGGAGTGGTRELFRRVGQTIDGCLRRKHQRPEGKEEAG